MRKIKLVRNFTGYTYIECSCEDAIKLLTYLKEAYGRNTSDIDDTLRILNNFNYFYDMMRRKFKDFISPKKEERDLIKGLVIVDKLKLFRKNDAELVQLVLDKRVELNLVFNILKELGMDFEAIQE